jgi:hypothetical protein
VDDALIIRNSGAVIVGLTQLGGLLDKLQGFTVNNIRLFQLSAADIQDFASSTGYSMLNNCF